MLFISIVVVYTLSHTKKKRKREREKRIKRKDLGGIREKDKIEGNFNYCNVILSVMSNHV